MHLHSRRSGTVLPLPALAPELAAPWKTTETQELHDECNVAESTSRVTIRRYCGRSKTSPSSAARCCVHRDRNDLLDRAKLATEPHHVESPNSAA